MSYDDEITPEQIEAGRRIALEFGRQLRQDEDQTMSSNVLRFSRFLKKLRQDYQDRKSSVKQTHRRSSILQGIVPHIQAASYINTLTLLVVLASLAFAATTLYRTYI